MKTSTILKRAKKLISDPKRWTKNAFAKASDGNVISPESDNAVCWCSMGAVRKASFGKSRYDQAKATLEMAAKRFRIVGVDRDVAPIPEDVNDHRDHATVMRMFDSAIRLAERQEANGQR